MRRNIYEFLRKVYGAVMLFAFLGGVLPLIPFAMALIIGGKNGEAVSVWLYKQYYPFIILSASVAVVIGLAAMYIGSKEGLSAGSLNSIDPKD